MWLTRSSTALLSTAMPSAVPGRSLQAAARQPHRPEPQAVDRQVPAQWELSAGPRRVVCCHGTQPTAVAPPVPSAGRKLPVERAGDTRGMEADQVIVLHGDSEFAARTGHLFAATRTTFACVVRDPATWARTSARDRASVRAEVTVTKLVSPAVLASEQYRGQLRRMSGGRPGPDQRQRTAARDHHHRPAHRDHRGRAHAGRARVHRDHLAGAGHGGERSFPGRVVSGRRLRLVPERGRPAPPGDSARDVLRALGEGLTDEAASRRLGYPCAPIAAG